MNASTAQRGQILFGFGPGFQLAVLQHLRHGADAGHHAAAVIALAEVRQHVVELDALAQGIGQHALQTAARDEPDFAQILDQQDTQTVVDLLRPYAPAAEQLDSERKGIAARDVVDRHDGHLRQPLAAQGAAQRIDPLHGPGGKDAVGIGDVVPAVGQLHVGNLVDAPRTGLGNGDERHAKNGQ